MVFSSQLFIFYFLPVALLVYYVSPRKARHLGLTLFSYLFYGWANPWFVQTISAFSVMTHFDAIQKGVLDSRDLLYFISVIVFSLFTTSVILRAHRAG